MLKSSFVHLHGFSKAKEKTLWDRGILTWDGFLLDWRKQMPLLGPDAMHPILKPSIEALRQGNVLFFGETMPRQEYYRVALEYPHETLFLDIETTGLSHYYDNITVVGWSLNNQYGAFIAGQDNSQLLDVLASAKCLVTFNGIMFDLKFIRKEFPGAIIPQIHIDLRFLAKRVGLAGGQKAIEKMIGWTRKDVPGISGETAPILWHSYRRGDLQALRDLIRYNHADIEGMKSILDCCVKKFVKMRALPKIPFVRFSKLKSKIIWETKGKKNVGGAILLKPYEGKDSNKFTIFDLNTLVPLEETPIAGIDLVASESKGTGFAIVHGSVANTQRVFTDDEMLSLIQANRVKLVSIDSPLSLPRGRTTVFDDDPNRQEYGIMRHCERELKRRGINVYPCLINCMQKLTRRGMELAGKIRALGIPVIESYPGAAQDIMHIPRKQAGLEWLRLGLKEFGITGPFWEQEVSHDELDAITSAVVGLFFWAGKFEALGIPEEDYLIIPDLKIDPTNWFRRKVLGLSGAIGVGKTTAAQFFEREKGYVRVRYSDVLCKILLEEGKKPTRSNLQELGWGVHNKYGQRWLGKKLVEIAGSAEKIVVDGVRFPEDVAYLAETFGPRYIHCHVDCSDVVCRNRLSGEAREDRPYKIAQAHLVEQGVDRLKSLANKTIDNCGHLSDFFDQLSAFESRETLCL